MAGLESEVFLIGRWDNFDDLEEKLTLDELTTIAKAIYDKDNSNRRFAAAIQGIDIDNPDNGEPGEMVDISQWGDLRQEIDAGGLSFEEEGE